MPGTLLIGHSRASWREWLKNHRKGRQIICLDPTETLFGCPARLVLAEDERALRWIFYGSLDPLRYPQVLLSAFVSLLSSCEGEPLVLMPPYTASPLQRHVFTLVAQMLKPNEILIAKDSPVSFEGWPMGPLEVQLEPEFPEMVLHAQRKARWLEVIEKSSAHEVPLSRVAIEGARLGSGRRLAPEKLAWSGLPAPLYAEVTGSTLLVIAHEDWSEEQVSRMLDHTHTSRINFVHPEAYDNLICSFADEAGEDFGFGMLTKIDFGAEVAHVLCTAVPPAPVRILKLGSLRVDEKGRELPEAKPWAV